jgi:MlaC protein
MNPPSLLRRGAVTCWSSCLALLCVAPAFAQGDAQITEFLASLNGGRAELAGRSSSDAAANCARIATEVMDMGVVVRNASARIWERMSSRQRAAYRSAALSWAVRNCVQRNQGSNGDPLEFAGTRRGENGDRLVATRSRAPSHLLVWRLHGSGKPRAVDLIVDGSSATFSLRKETESLLERYGDDIDAMIVALRR